MTVKELRATAASYGLKGYSRMNKAELEAAIDSRILELREETGKRIAEQANSHADQVQNEQTDNMRDILNALPASKIRRIARIVKLPGYTTFTTRYLRGRLHCWIFSEDGCNGLRALAVKLSRDDFMEVVNVIGTEDLRDELYPIFSFKYLEKMTRDDCISNVEWDIFIRENLKIRQYDKIPDRWKANADELREFVLAQERREQEDRKREKEEEINARREYCRQRKEAEDFRNAFQNAQRTLAIQAMTITRYMQAKPATAIAALPATVEHQPATPAVIEHQEQPQPEVVEQTSTDSYYSQNYDEIEHICFIRRVKNGHVPRQFLAELSPEEYAQVMQEVADMEKREQERERAQQAQPQPELLPAASCFYTPNPEPIIVEKCDQVFRFEIGKLYQLRGDYGNPSHRKSVIAKVIATADDCVHFEIHGKVFYSSDSWFIRYHDEEGNETHTISQWAQICYFEIDGQTDTVEAYADEVFTEQPQPEVVEQTAPSNQDDDDPDPTPPSNGGKSPATVRKTTHANPNYGTVHGMTTRELRKAAKNLDIKGYAKMDRAQLDEVMSRYPRRLARRTFDFSLCANEEILRSRLRYFSSQQLEITARNLKGKTIALPIDDKLITKKFLIDAIVKVYFPQTQTAPAPIIEQAQHQPDLKANPNPEFFRRVNQTFKAGVTYSFTFMNGGEATCKVINRTESTAIILASGDKKEHRVKIYHHYDDVNAEYLHPKGQYSMSPICKPSHPVSISTFTVGQLYGAVEPDARDTVTVAECMRVDGDRVFFQIHFRDGRGPVIDSSAVVDLTTGTERTYLTILGLGHLAADHTVPVPEWCNPRINKDMAKFEIGQTYGRQFNDTFYFFTVIKREGVTLTVTNNRNPDTYILLVAKDGTVGDDRKEFVKWQYGARPSESFTITAKDHTTPAVTVRHEAWQDHICDHCNHVPTWTHEQFSTGILLAREYRYSSSKYSRMLWLASECNLVQIYELAKLLGLDISKIELTSGYSKTTEKKLQIANIIWNEIISMEHVYVCTYEGNNPPALPAELVEPEPVAIPANVPLQNTPAPATRKPRHAKTIDTSRQILISFGDEETHATASTPAKPKRRATRKPRIKKDYSRQLVFVFDEVIDSKTDQRIAA